MPSNTTTVITQTSALNANVAFYNAQGAKGTVILGALTPIDLKLADDHWLVGGGLLVKNAVFGDYCDMLVIDKDLVLKGQNVPGTPYTYDQLPGYPVLRQFVSTYYLDDTKSDQGGFDSPSVAKILAGTYLRVNYTSTTLTGTAPKVAINYKLYKVLV
jgi:hypothetical protein